MAVPGVPPRWPWIAVLWSLNAVFLAGTSYTVAQWPGELIARPLNINSENSVGAWWSGFQLFITALLLYSVALAVAQIHRQLYWPLLSLSALLAGLFVDEVGSLHERVSIPFGQIGLLPFAVLLVAMLGYGLWGLHRYRDQTGNARWFILAAFLAFFSVVLQDRAEHMFQGAGWLLPLRTVLEEGTELVGFFLIFVGVASLRRRFPAAPGERALLTPNLLPAPAALQMFMLVAVVFALPVLLIRVAFNDEQLTIPMRGDFGYVIPSVALVLPAFAAARLALLDRERRMRWATLAAALGLASVDMCAHKYRYPLRLLGGEEGWRADMAAFAHAMWRNDVGLLWTTPLVLAAILLVSPLRGGKAVAGGLLIMAMAAGSAALSQPLLILVVCYLATLGGGYWLLRRINRQERAITSRAEHRPA